MAVGGDEIKPSMWRNPSIGLRLGTVRTLPLVLIFAGSTGCQILESGLPEATTKQDAATQVDVSDGLTAFDVGEPPGVTGDPIVLGCSDGTREGFRDYVHWSAIAGCAGGFNREKGIIRTQELLPTCGLLAGDTSANPSGLGCSAADLCAVGWHVCQDGHDVAIHSPTGDCENCVPAGEPRFFLVAIGASVMGICSPDLSAANDLHGCGGLGQPESEACFPLSRRMGFADCLKTNGVWSCGKGEADSLQEALVVKKSGPSMGGVLCCRD
jgi:hypothetical protein